MCGISPCATRSVERKDTCDSFDLDRATGAIATLGKTLEKDLTTESQRTQSGKKIETGEREERENTAERKQKPFFLSPFSSFLSSLCPL
jgi:hypothetical protein